MIVHGTLYHDVHGALIFLLSWVIIDHGVTTSVGWIRIHLLPLLALTFRQYRSFSPFGHLISFLRSSDNMTFRSFLTVSSRKLFKSVIICFKWVLSWISSFLMPFSPYVCGFQVSHLCRDNHFPLRMCKGLSCQPFSVHSEEMTLELNSFLLLRFYSSFWFLA